MANAHKTKAPGKTRRNQLKWMKLMVSNSTVLSNFKKV